MRSLERFIETLELLSRARSEREIHGLVTRTVREYLGADGATFVKLDGDAVHYVEEDAIRPLWRGERFPLHKCISGWVIEHKEPVIVDDALTDERTSRDIYEPTFVRSLVMAPIRPADPLGAIGAYWAKPRQPGLQDARLVTTLASATALALENLRLFDQVRAREERLRAVFDSSLQSLVVFDRTFCLVDANAVAQTYARDLFGRELRVGENMRELLRGFAGSDGFGAYAERAFAGEKITHLSEIEHRGQPAWFEICYEPVRDGSGEVEMVTLAVLDVTERTAAQANEARLAAIVEGSPDIVAMTNPDASMLYVNRAGRVRLGVGDTPVEELSVFDFHPPAEHDTVRHVMEEVRTHGSWRGEVTVCSLDGHEFVVEATVRAHRVGDRITHLSLVGRDLTEERHMQEQVTRAQRAEAIGRLTQGIAHDFNNALTPILCGAALLEAQLRDDEKASANAHAIADAADHAAALTRQLLALSRRQVLDMAPTDLNAEILTTVTLLRRTIAENIEIATDLSPDLPHVTADRTQLAQVLMNLVINAAEAIGDRGGHITITTRCERDACSDHPGSMVLRVRDDGPGLAPDEAARAFEPFFTTKGERGGTGLGLATSQGIVTQHGGTIDLDTAPGRGAEFTITLPVGNQAPTPITRPPLRAAPSERATLLVVDDDPRVLAAMRRVLVERGYRVVTAASLEEAVETARAAERAHDPIDLLISDVVLRSGGGPELYRELIEDFPRLQVLYVTGHPSDAIARHGVLYGDANVLMKPFRAEQLASAVYGVLTGDATRRMS